MRISDWSSDVCSSDLVAPPGVVLAFRVERAVGVDPPAHARGRAVASAVVADPAVEPGALGRQAAGVLLVRLPVLDVQRAADDVPVAAQHVVAAAGQPLVEGRPQPVHGLELEALAQLARRPRRDRSEEHTSELQSLMRISYAVL